MKILVIEDEHRIANTMKKGLELEHYSVDVSYDGLEGYDLASSGSYDVIILDLMPPGIGGMHICSQLREEKIHTPILMLTAKSKIQDKVEGLNAGADDYLAKPFSFEELLARIRALTRRPQQVTPSVLTVGTLTLDPLQFIVTREQRVIQLSSKEFSLLEYLMRNHNKILSKQQIIDHVWNYESDILPNTVEVYIRNLRKKIDEPFSSPLLRTVRGFGYKIG